jgi:hypothetical protein
VYDGDDPGMRPRPVHPAPRNKPYAMLNNDDVEGSRACHRKALPPRGTNPLQPDYRLPS